jgi:hypothetical protein
MIHADYGGLPCGSDSPTFHQMMQHGLCVNVDLHERSSSTIPTPWWQGIHAGVGWLPFDKAHLLFHSTNNTLGGVIRTTSAIEIVPMTPEAALWTWSDTTESSDSSDEKERQRKTA